jgi:hypothetical protein
VKAAKNGGPAFPVVFQDSESSYGMSLRDYFAAQMLQGFAVAVCIASAEAFTPDNAAAAAYQFADAMLRARVQADG